MLMFKRLIFILLYMTLSSAIGGTLVEPSPPTTYIPNLGYVDFWKTAYLMGPIDPPTVVNFTVWLKLINQTALEAYINELYDPSSANYQKFLTKQEFDDKFRPTAADVESVRHFFAHAGMQAQIKDDCIRVKGTTKQINKALHITLSNYLYEGRVIMAPDSQPCIRNKAGLLVSNFLDLDNIWHFTPIILNNIIVSIPVKNL